MTTIEWMDIWGRIFLDCIPTEAEQSVRNNIHEEGGQVLSVV